MAKITFSFFSFLFIILGCNSGVPETGIVVISSGDTIGEYIGDTIIVVPADTAHVYVNYAPRIQRDTITIEKVYLSQVGVREATGRNDGAAVEMYLRSVGLTKGNPWCAAFVHWCLDSAGIQNKVTGWSPTAHNPGNLVWYGKKFYKPPEPGDVFCLYFPSLKRVAHTGFYRRTVNSTFYETVEGNTNAEGSREGDGVYMKKRSFNATYSITRHKN